MSWKKRIQILSFASLLINVVHSPARAQPPKNPQSNPSPPTQNPPNREAQRGMMGGMMGGWHYSSPYGQMYFSGIDVTLEGTVVEMSTFTPRPQMMRGSQLILKTSAGQKTLHLGPEWYVREQELKLKKGDHIVVRGKQVGEGEKSFIIASELKKDQQTWTLRDKDGLPYWCANRMTPPQ